MTPGTRNIEVPKEKEHSSAQYRPGRREGGGACNCVDSKMLKTAIKNEPTHLALPIF